MFFKTKKPQLDKNNLPQHIGIIMDGNGRWATRRGLPRSAGHRAGVNALRAIANECGDLGIKSLTVYTFSTENSSRSPEEVAELMRLVKVFLDDIEKEIGGKNVVLRIIGERDIISREMIQSIQKAEAYTDGNTGLNFNIALFYGGRAEIVSAVNKIISRGEKPTEQSIQQNLYTAGQPPLDLIIRCGSEKRLSNFMLWQSSYAELYFCDTLWPDFNVRCLHQAIAEYQRRNRTFGGVK